MSIKAQIFQHQQGLSIIEVIIAIAILITIASSSVVAILGSFSTTRLSKEQSQATSLAKEGIEATTSLANQNWASVNIGTHGLSNIGNVWSFSGSFDTQGKYTRVVTVSEVERDSNDDIVAAGGTVDLDSLYVKVDVNWNFTSTRNNTVSLTTLLTNWQQSVGQSGPAPTPTPTPGPTPTPVSCTEVCQGLNYTSGTCRKNTGACNSNGETHESTGNAFCTGGSNADTCCCAP